MSKINTFLCLGLFSLCVAGNEPADAMKTPAVEYFLQYYNLSLPQAGDYKIKPRSLLGMLHDFEEGGYCFEIQKHDNGAGIFVKVGADGTAFGDIFIADNPRDALFLLGKRVTESSMILEQLLPLRFKFDHGAGELCIVSKHGFDEKSGRFSDINGSYFFLRHGLVVRIKSTARHCNIDKIAKLLDKQILLAVEKIQTDGVPPPSEVAEPAPRSAAELPPQGLEVSLTEPTQLPDDFFTDQLKQLEDIKDKNAANCLAIAEIYFYGRKGIPVAKAKAVAYYRQAYDLAEAELSRNASDAQALYIAGLSAEKLLNGIDFMSCLKKAADAGYAPAEAELAFRYMKGIGVTADFNNAYEYALKASEQGNMFGRGLLGSYYVVVKKDLKEGLRLLQESAEAGDPGGQYMLFYCLKYMPGIVRNDALAMELLRLSADRGLPDAVSKLQLLKQK